MDHGTGNDQDVVPPRTPLIADHATGTLRIGDRPIPVAADGDPLASYLSTIYAARGVERGQRIPLRDDDLNVLAGLVGDDPVEVEARLIELMDCTPEEARKLRALLFRRRTLATAAGIALGIAAMVGTLHEASSGGGKAAPQALSLLQPGSDGELIAPASSSAIEERGVASERAAQAIGAVTPSGDVVPTTNLPSVGSLTDDVVDVDLPLDPPSGFETPAADTSNAPNLPSGDTGGNPGVGGDQGSTGGGTGGSGGGGGENENNAGGGGNGGGGGNDGDHENNGGGGGNDGGENENNAGGNGNGGGNDGGENENNAGGNGNGGGNDGGNGGNGNGNAVGGNDHDNEGAGNNDGDDTDGDDEDESNAGGNGGGNGGGKKN